MKTLYVDKLENETSKVLGPDFIITKALSQGGHSPETELRTVKFSMPA